MAISTPSFNQQQQQYRGGQQMFNPHQSALMGGIGAMNGLSGLLSSAFGATNALNSQNRLTNNALNVQSQGINASVAPAYYQYLTARMEQEAQNARQTQSLGLLSQLIGSLGGIFGGAGGGAGGGGFTTNYGASATFGDPTGAGGAGAGAGAVADPAQDVMARLKQLTAGRMGATGRNNPQFGMNLSMPGKPQVPGLAPGMVNGQQVGSSLLRGPAITDNPIGGGRKPKPQPTRKPARPGLIDVTTDV